MSVNQPWRRPLDRRSFLAASGAAMLGLGLSACGGGGGSGGGASFPQPEGDIPAEYKGRTRVVFWQSWGGDPGKVLDGLVKEYNDSQKEIYVEAQFQGTYDETAQKLAVALQAKQIPDIVSLSEVTWNKFYLNDVLEPLDDYYSGDFTPDVYVDQLASEGVVKDKFWWAPFSRSTPLFYYNRDLFAQAGLPDRGPATWSELSEWGAELSKLQIAGKTPKVHAFGKEWDWQFQGSVWQWDGNLSKDLEVTVDTGGAVEAAEWQRKFIHDDGLGYMTTDVIVDFSSQLAATVTGSTGSLRTLTETSQFEVGAAFLPEEDAFGCPTGGAGLSILASASTERKQAAFEFLKFLGQPEKSATWTVGTGYLPVVKAAVDVPELKTLLTDNSNFSVAVDQLPKTHRQDAVRLFAPSANITLYTGLQQIHGDNRPAQDVMTEVGDKLRKSVEEIRAAYESHH